MLLFGYTIYRPVSSNRILLPVFFAMAVLALMALRANHLQLYQPFRWVILLQISLGVFGVSVGILHHNPGWMDGALLYVVAPMLFWLIVSALDVRSVRWVMWTLAIGTIVISVTILLLVLHALGIIPRIVPAALASSAGAGVSISGGSTAVRFYGLSTLAAAGPMWAASVLVKTEDLMPPIAVRSLAAGSAILAALVSDRTAITLAIVLAPALLWVGLHLISRPGPGAPGQRPLVSRRTLGIGILALIAIGATATLLGLSASPIAAAYHKTEAIISGKSDDVRTTQHHAFVEATPDAALVGAGLGSVVPGMTRNVDKPWHYELQYHLLIYSLGIPGIALAALALLSALRILRRAARVMPERSGTLAIALTGALAMALANATNPYLAHPSHLWAVYLPFAIANVSLHPNPREEVSS